MNKWFDAWVWLDADKGDGKGDGGNGNGDGKKPEDKPAEKTFTQADLDRVAGETRKAGRESGVSELLKDLGFEKADDLKTLVTEAKKRSDAEKTESQKLQEQLAQVTKAKDEADLARQEAIEKANVTLMRAAIMTEAGKPEYKIKPEALADVWTFVDRAGIKPKDGADGEYTGIDAALKALVKAKPYLVDDAKPNGTPRPGQRKSGSHDKPEPGKGFTL